MKNTLSVPIVLLCLLSACIFRNPAATVAGNPTVTETGNGTAATSQTEVLGSAGTVEPAPTSTSFIRRAAGGVNKICQLTGDTDRELNQPTLNQTGSRFGVFGTDLGFSFPFGGQLYFLFGDTVGLHAGDSIAYSSDDDPEDCLQLQFVTGPDGRYLPPKVPGISLGPFEVPTGAFSAGEKMYVFFSTDHTDEKVMGRSVLARSDDRAKSFILLYDVSADKFLNIDPVIVDNASIPGLPQTSGQGVLLWGTGNYRKSNPYLAFVPFSSVEDRGAWRFFAGIDSSTGLPRWSGQEGDAAALFDHPCLGELSVAQYDDLGKWLMLYNCALPRGITMRSADAPWGPWSDGEVIFQPWDDGGYCHFMHVAYDSQNCDSVQDPGRDDEWAGEYGPYLIPSLARSQGGVTTVYFVMSVWNPYAVMLMKTELTAG